MAYIARKPFRYGSVVYMTGQAVPVAPDDVRMLQGQGKISGTAPETASVKPPENAMMPKAEPKHLGGGWYEVRGKKIQGKERAEAEASRPFDSEGTR